MVLVLWVLSTKPREAERLVIEYMDEPAYQLQTGYESWGEDAQSFG